MDDETDPREDLAAASISLLGREFNIGPLCEGKEFELHAQIKDAQRVLKDELHIVEMGRQYDWLMCDASVDNDLMVMRLRLKILQAILDQVPDPNSGEEDACD